MANAIIERTGGVGVDCDDATATTAQVLTGYTFGGAASDEIQNGAMVNQGTVNYTITTNGGSYTIGQGYHSGSGKVTYTLPSANGGITYTPTAAAQTIPLSGKYLKANSTVSGSSNLTAGNILKGKTIWGVAGSFVNIATVSQVYNGSSFSGFLSGGVINRPTANGTAYQTYYGSFSGKGANGAITSGQLYLTTDTSFGTSSPYGIVSAKSINFSLFSTLRITGYFTASVYVTNYASAYVSMQVTAKERTNNGSTTTVSASINKYTDDFSFRGRYEEDDWGGGTINFDLSYDISSWTDTGSFLEILVSASNKATGSYINWRGMTFYITGIYLT